MYSVWLDDLQLDVCTFDDLQTQQKMLFFVIPSKVHFHKNVLTKPYIQLSSKTFVRSACLWSKTSLTIGCVGGTVVNPLFCKMVIIVII